MWCPYCAVNFLPNLHKIHSIAHPLGWDKGYLLWIQSVFNTLTQSPQGWIQYIKNNAWVTANNDFGVNRDAICQWFSRVTTKIVIHGKECIIIFLTRYFMFWTCYSAKNNHRSLISLLSPRMVFSDLALWRHHSWSLTSRESGILTLWHHIRRLFLHAQIGAKAIFTSE